MCFTAGNAGERKHMDKNLTKPTVLKTTKKIKAQCMLKHFALSFTATNHDFGKK